MEETWIFTSSKSVQRRVTIFVEFAIVWSSVKYVATWSLQLHGQKWRVTRASADKAR
jgi:hypothetical protein